MNVSVRIKEYSDPKKEDVIIHSHGLNGSKVMLEIDDKKYTVVGDELISAVKRCMLDCFGK